MNVRRSIKNDLDGGWVVGPPKSHQARTIALDSFTLTVLRQHRGRVEAWASDAGVVVGAESYALTLDPSGLTPMKPDSLGQAFRRLCEREGLPELTLHSLRHFSASMLIASGRELT